MFLDTFINRMHASLYRYEEALRYLESRGVTDEEIKRFRLGYNNIAIIPDDGSKERQRFLDEGLKGKKYERRIIIPFEDVLGRVNGLLARSIESREFKIFATEEAKFSGYLFGLPQALPSIYETGKAYVVEGPFDLLAMIKVVPNVVATITAGINEAQHALLRLFARYIVTIFDSDSAGRKAAQTAKRLSWSDFDINLGYGDPSNCLKEKSLDGFKKHVQFKIKEAIL